MRGGSGPTQLKCVCVCEREREREREGGREGEKRKNVPEKQGSVCEKLREGKEKGDKRGQGQTSSCVNPFM